MRIGKRAGNVVLGLAFLVAITGSAFARNSGRLNLRQAVTVNGVPLDPGKYTVSWQTHSPEATVTFRREKGAVATTEGRVEKRQSPYDNDSVVFENNPDGSRTILEIRFAGSKNVLTFGESSPSSESIVPKPETASVAAAQSAKISGSAPVKRSTPNPALRQQDLTLDPYLLQTIRQTQQSNPLTPGRQMIVQ